MTVTDFERWLLLTMATSADAEMLTAVAPAFVAWCNSELDVGEMSRRFGRVRRTTDPELARIAKAANLLDCVAAAE